MGLPLIYKKLFRVRVMAVCSLVVFGCMFSQDSFSSNDEQSKAPKPDYSDLKRFRQVLEIILKNYVVEVNGNDLVRASIRGMLESLGANNAFLTEDEFGELQIVTKNDYGAVGVEIEHSGFHVTVVGVIENTTGEKSGIKPGDKILEIDGESTRGMTLTSAVRKLRGRVGSTVTLTISRKGSPKPRKFEINRAPVHLQTVRKQQIEPGFIYLKIVNFPEDMDVKFAEALKNEGRVKGLVIDLRKNSGGLLDQAVKLSNFFLERGLIVYTDARVKDQRMEFRASSKTQKFNFKTAVLIDENSAGSSEIFAAAMQDHNRALVFGTKSHGHARVATIIPLDNGCGLRLTTANYFSPKGRQIDKVGILPDVDLSEEIEAQDSRLTDETQKARYYSKSVDPKTDIVLYKAIDWLKSDLTVEDYKSYKKN